jgi:MOSC domain-containing protein YiiM
MARVVSLNVGRPRSFDYRGRSETSAIWKTPVEGRIRARGVNLEGDDQADRTVHGGPDKAVYAYALEDLKWWEKELGRKLDPGALGENLDSEGVDVTNAVIGEKWRIGSALFQVSEPRAPCWKLGNKMEDPGFIRRFTEAGRTGAYLRILEEGQLGRGDAIEVFDRPPHGVTIAEVFHIFSRDRARIARLLDAPELGRSWREWAEEQIG